MRSDPAMLPCLQVCAELNKAIRGVMSGYLVGLTVKGVGYRMEPADDALAQVGQGREGAGSTWVRHYGSEQDSGRTT